MQKKGFAVFTPMVGTLVIIITILIVSSIIQSERVNMAGTIKSYKSTEMANLAQEVQSRVIEGIRESIVSELAKPDVMAVTVKHCPPKAIDETIFEEPTCNGKPCICGTDLCVKGQTCEADIFYQTNATATNFIRISAFLETSVKAAVEKITDKYSLVKIKYLNPPLDKVSTTFSFIDCSPSDDQNPFKSCPDGRLNIKVDFTALEGVPVAEISSQTKRMNVYLPAVKKEYTSTEPYGMYALAFARIFSNFQLLNNSWHGAGWSPNGYDNSNAWLKTNGSEWFHYNYAVHLRNPGSTPPDPNSPLAQGEPFSSMWNPGFQWDDNNEVVQYFINGYTLTDYILYKLHEYAPVGQTPEGKEYGYRTALRWDYVRTNFEYLLYFSSGFFTQETDTVLIGKGLPDDSYQSRSGAKGVIQGIDGYPLSSGVTEVPLNEHVLAGGCITPTSSPDYPCSNGLYSAGSNCLSSDSLFRTGALLAQPYTGNIVLVNNTADFDEQRQEIMENVMEQLKEAIDSNPEIYVGMGFGTPDALKFNLTISSKQYYVSGYTEGGNNWHCGQFVTEYVPSIPLSAPNPCNELRTSDTYGANPNYGLDGLVYFQ
ncbi:MAG: hypothetical protein J7K68_01925, partial [Candidatus Diapherotrites archaeon]|nr:hypothetical protein [Candidatus Diapherotrites archaeon]